jgi:FixJ family two-component response regulator
VSSSFGEALVHIVDDDASLRIAIARLLRSYEIPARTYESAQDFLNRLPKPDPGCLILDLSLPGMNGLELQEVIALRLPCLAVVFVTGEGDIRTSVKAMKAGAVDFLTKPFEDHVLIRAVEEGINRSRRMFADQAQVEKDWVAFTTLTEREKQVCILITEGLLNKQISYELGPKEKTIKLHRSQVMRKLPVGSVADLVKLVERLRDAGRIGQPAQKAAHAGQQGMASAAAGSSSFVTSTRAEEPRYDRRRQADHKAGNHRKVESAALTFEPDIPRQSPQSDAEPFAGEYQKSRHNKQNARADQQTAHLSSEYTRGRHEPDLP